MANAVKIHTYNDPKSPLSEIYRTLRTNIKFLSVDRELKTILFTSTGPDEGKSTVVANLAVTLCKQEAGC
jgi:Mrp family chromosome partitioning ATPase